MDNPIKFSDLFGDDVRTGLDSLISQVGQVEGTLLSMLKDVKKEARELSDALAGTSSATREDREATSQYAAEVEKLRTANDKLTKSLTSVQSQLEGMRKSKSNEKRANDALLTSYASLQTLLEDTKVNLDELVLSEKARIQIAKNGQTANTALGGSYNQLYAQYNLCKIALNAMTDSMRNSEKVGKVWEAEALRIMNTMKGMQAATGKHTLEVGNYEESFTKAMNGLQISTQQVLREMPTLANSLQQFFIAISNNVPIFVDNLKRVQKETGSWAVAMKGVLASVFSWQTILLVVLTILPKVAKAIHDKKKAQKEDSEVTRASVAIHQELNRIYLDTAKSINENISKLRNIYRISQDVNRSMQDRIDAAKALKHEYEDAFSNYTAEEIALGKAKTDYEELTRILVEQARARAYLNKITELEGKYIDQEPIAKKAKAAKEAAKADMERAEAALNAHNAERTTTQNMEERNAEYNRLNLALQKAKKAYEDASAAFSQADMPLQEIDNEILRLRKSIPAYAIVLDGAGRKTKETTNKMKDYYWEWAESVANILEDEEDRALELNDVKYKHAIANMEAQLEELKANGQLTVQQEEYMTGIITNLETERQQRRMEIIKEYLKKTSDAIAQESEIVEEEFEEEDLSISGRYEKRLAENAEKLLASRESLNKALESGSYAEAKAEGEAFKQLTIEKLKLEEELQEELLAMRLETGELTAEQYTIELANIRSKLAKDIAGLNRNRRGRFSLATMLFGDIKEDGKGNVYKELSAEAQSFVSNLKSAMSSAFDYMNEWMDKRIEMAEVAVEAAQKEKEAAKDVLDYEMEARANGYANNVELARREYEEKLTLERQAIAEKERLQKIQDSIDTATQMSSLLTASAELWSAHASIPGGALLALAAIGTMWGSFASAKIKAAQMTATKYGDGMSEYLDYGGSHASGNDIDFGADKSGRRRRVERGEMIGVINKRNVDKYGVGKITDIIQSLNKGTFENKYSSVVDAVVPEMNADLYHLAFAGFNQGTDLGRVESSLQTLIEQGETKVVTTPYGRIEYRGNNKRIIHNS